MMCRSQRGKVNVTMIHADISNVWGAISLQDLLGIEQEIFAAHMAAAEQKCAALLPEQEMLEKICGTARRIRENSDVLVVLGAGGNCLGIRGVLELLQGPDRNLKNLSVIFAGNSLSTRQWKQVRENLEGKRFSVLILSGPGDGRESLLILRDLKWTLDRKYGTDESSRRIIAAASAADERLNRMAQAYGWDCFEIPSGCGGSFGVLSAAGLLVMEAAGLDASAMWQGAAEAQKELDLRSFENPVWLYAAVRNLMLRCGKTMELVSAWEPGFSNFGAWWRQLFLEGEGRGLIPVSALLPGDNHLLERMLQGQRENFLETMVQFAPVEESCIISLDANNLDELNHLSDRMLSDLEEETCLQTLDHRVDQGIGMIALECGALEERTLGQLICFLELSCVVSAYTLGVCPREKTEEAREEEA